MAIPLVDLGPILANSARGPAALSAELGPSTLPLALFPVRLETRFFGLELRVRVYPDKVHLDAHQPSLDADEMLWGRRFWEVQWDDERKLRDAWRMLAGRFGPERAAWVARALTPANLSSRPSGAPAFPDLGEPATTTRIPRARLLPDRWVATAYAGGVVVAAATGRDIEADLAIGPNLEADVTIDHEQPAVDSGMRWMIDFDRAEQAGMALRLTLPTPAVDVLLVTGVSKSDGSAALAAQLDAHRYTDGLAFMPPASTTNNTAAGRTPYQEPDPQHEKSFAREWDTVELTAGSGADLASKAFGIGSFSRLASGRDRDDAGARAMATALWPATWGYFLSQMVGFNGTGLTLAGRAWARAHALDHLRPGGPLPVLRLGRQPYGVLPVTSLDSWTTTEAAGTALRDVLLRLRDAVFRPASMGAPRVGRSDDPSADLVDVLQGGALSSSYRVRALMGQHFLQHLRAFLGEELDAVGFWSRLVQLSSRLPTQLGFGVFALAHAAYDGVTREITVPLVGTPTYINELLAVTDPEPLAAPVPSDRVPLLRALLRHALLREYAEAAARALDPANPALLRDAELVDLVPSQSPTPTWSWLRVQPMAEGRQVRDALAGDAVMAEFRAALQTMATMEVPALERHLATTLDATSHRLDAWITSLASRRLAEIRAATPHGIGVGGYGWVENLRPATPGPAVSAPDEPGPLVAPPDDPGFIHAPSLNQASAAAMLRNAHLSHGSERDSPYAIELTSGRVRLAKQLFEGVRQGQPIGALLGYTFERNLHEAGLDELIDDFRAVAPLPGASEHRIVVDGLALAAKWRDAPDSVLAPSHPRRARAQKILDALELTVDAAADAVHAESVFQMVRGNVARAAASLDAISTGTAPPPDLAFLGTPRTGTGLTHRVAMLLPADGGDNLPDWADRASSPRAQADPALNAWAGRLLGPATGITARVLVDGDSSPRVVPLSALGLTPIDLVWATEGTDGVPREIAARVLHAVGVTAGHVDLSRAAGGLGDLVELATRAHRLLAGARSMDGADLMPPHAEPVRGLDLDEFERRTVAAEQALAAAHNALAQALADGVDPKQAMLRIAAFGVPGAIPLAGSEVAKSRALLAETARRITAPALPASGSDEARRDQLVARLRTVFGSGFIALPRFIASNASEVEASLADAALAGDDPLAVYTWLQRMERVREPLARLARPLREAEVLGRVVRLELSVAQVPHVSGQRWVGLELLEAGRLVDGAASLVFQNAPEHFGGALCGMLVDEWTELVPGRNETTGIAFQYDPPDASAPQVILLAVPPVIGQPWTVGGLNRVLLETLDLLRLRVVDPVALGDLGHYLPATYLAFNANAEAVSTDLNPLAP
jgi:hypothetical protein